MKEDTKLIVFLVLTHMEFSFWVVDKCIKLCSIIKIQNSACPKASISNDYSNCIEVKWVI